MIDYGPSFGLDWTILFIFFNITGWEDGGVMEELESDPAAVQSYSITVCRKNIKAQGISP